MHTDARGLAVLRVPADANMQWIVGAKRGVGFDYFENDRSGWLTPWVRPPQQARLVLDGVRTVRIRAVDSAGRPVAGVELATTMIRKKGKLGVVGFPGFPINPRTDANGVATFDWLPAGLIGHTSFHSASPSYAWRSGPVLDPDKPEAELTALVLRSTRVAGKVTFPDGSPAPGILVEARGWGGRRSPIPHSARARTGRRRLLRDGSAPDYSYMIGVTDDEWAVREPRRHRGPRGRRPDRRRPEARARERGPRSGDPRVRREAGAGRTVQLVELGQPVPAGAFPAEFDELRGQLVRFAKTDEDGRYTLLVGPGTHRLVGPIVPGKPTRQMDLKIAAGTEVERNFQVPSDDRPWKTVRGVVGPKCRWAAHRRALLGRCPDRA